MRRSALLLSLLALPFGCSDTTPPEPARSFDRPDALEAVCVQTANADGTPLAAFKVLPIGECGELPSTTASAPEVSPLPALRPMMFVSQVGRGEVALVDLARSTVLDADRGTPGLNAVPAAALPTALRVSADAQTVYLASGAPRAFGIFAMQAAKLLEHALTGQGNPIGLPDWRGCSLAERPIALEALDAQTLAVLTSGGDGQASKLVLLEASPFAEGEGAYAAGETPACKVRSATALGGVGSAVGAPKAWPLGMVGEPLSTTGLPLGEPAVCTDVPASAPVVADALPVATLMRKEGTRLYIGERSRAVVHVVETAGGAARLVQQLTFAGEMAGSWASDIAVSPETRDAKRFAYVVDGRDGALAVFDLSDFAPVLQPLRRPRAEATPGTRADRIQLSAPAVSVKFFARDWLADGTQKAVADAKAAVLCNPNPAQAATAGGAYAKNGSYAASVLGPTRMRGVFAAVALSNGDVVFVDVDDWDEPCRRPADLSAAARVNAYGDAQVDDAQSPWGAPRVSEASVSNEWFYPVSSPHRLRSAYALSVNDTEGTHAPTLSGTPVLSLANQPLPITGAQSLEQPSMLPVRASHADPGWKTFAPSADTEVRDVAPLTPGSAVAVPRVRMSWEDPTAHQSQSWSVVYEGALPGLDNVSGTLSPQSDARLSLDVGTPGLCAYGVEDFAVGTGRASRGDAELSALGLPAANYVGRVGDYARITSALLPADDAYWALPGDSLSCWGGVESAAARHDLCDATFSEPTANAWTRDLPVLEAYDDHMVLGQYNYGAEDQGRGHRLASSLSRSFADKVRCCFHGQLNVAVRAGGEWLANGTVSGFLHHVVKGQAGRCELACQSDRRLSDARALSVPRPTTGTFTAPDVQSALAFRNPSFSFVMYAPKTAAVPRDTTWKFDVRGGFSPLGFSIPSKQRTTAVNLRALEIYPNLGEFVALDASSQGLVFVRLDTLTQARPVIY